MIRPTTSGTLVVPDVVLLSIDDQVIGSRDLVATLQQRGTLDVVRATCRSGEVARARGEAPDAARRTTEATFRSARHLATAEEMESWLQAWHLTVGAWRGAMRRLAARTHHADSPDDPDGPVREPTDDDLWAELVCGGVLADAARALAADLAASVALGIVGDPPQDLRDQWTFRSVDDAMIDRELSDRALEWLHVGWVELQATSEAAAREARLCLDHDRQPVERVAELLGTHASPRDAFLHRCEPGLRDLLVEIDVGETSEPDALEDGHRIVHVLHRTAPDPADARLRTAVRSTLSDQALDLEVRDRVRWHVDF